MHHFLIQTCSVLQGWEHVSFHEGFQYVNQSCKTVTINSRMPVNRAGHTAVSTGSEALVCGGFNFKGDKPVLVGNGKDLECWWFTPLPYPRFDPLLLESGSPIPSARWGHTMSDDPKRGHVLLFGGTANAQVFNDCWVLMLSGATHCA